MERSKNNAEDTEQANTDASLAIVEMQVRTARYHFPTKKTERGGQGVYCSGPCNSRNPVSTLHGAEYPAAPGRAEMHMSHDHT